MAIRERTEQLERSTLSEYAALSAGSRGRAREEDKCEVRTEFQRDRDRILHSKSFRRLKHKTQVFLCPEQDHYRTRLTHTLEVSQIARTIARALRLNEDLTEAISLGHDLGHTPFGHAGERALDDVSALGFVHYEQSVRVVEKLEGNGKGLNLTWEVIDGIRCHTKGEEAKTLEGRIVRVADRIAYINHDIDDAIRAGVLSDSAIPRHIVDTLGGRRSERINTLVMSIIEHTEGDRLCMGEAVQTAFSELHGFMFDQVYLNPVAKGEESKVPGVITALYNHFVACPMELPLEYQTITWQEGLERAVCDFIAGMTDRYAITLFKELYVPKSWNG